MLATGCSCCSSWLLEVSSQSVGENEGVKDGGRRSDSSWMLSKENALVHHSVNLHAYDHRTVVLKSTVSYRKPSTDKHHHRQRHRCRRRRHRRCLRRHHHH